MLPLFFREAGVDEGTIGLIFLVMTFTFAVSEFLWGWMADRIDLRIAMLIGTLVLSLATATFLVSPSLAIFFLTAALVGFFRPPLIVISRWYVGIHAPPSMKALAMASLSTMFSLALSAAGFASGFIADAYGYRAVIWVAAGLPFLAGMGVAIAYPGLHLRGRGRAQEAASDGVEGAKDRQASSLSIAVWLGFLGISYFITFGVFFTYLPLFTTDIVHGNEQQVGVLFGVRGLINAVAMLPLGRLADRMGKTRFITAGLAVVAVSMIGIARASSYSAILLWVVVYSLGASLYQPAGIAVLSERTTSSRMGTAVGIYGMFEDVGWMIGPAAGGLLWDTGGAQAPFVMAAGAAGIGAALSVYLARRVLSKE
jgi:MFS family permease